MSLMPIGELHPLVPQGVAVRARVVQKEELKHITTKAGKPLTVFSATLMDGSGSIRASFFSEAAEKFHPVLQEGKMYTLSKFRVKMETMFRNVSPYNMTMESFSSIEPAEDDKSVGSSRKVNCKPISELSSPLARSLVDVVAVVARVDPKRVVKQTMSVVNVLLVDSTMRSIELTFFGDSISVIDEGKALEGHPVVLIQDVAISDFNSRSLVFGRSSTLRAGHEAASTEDGQRLQAWWKSSGAAAWADGAGEQQFVALSHAPELGARSTLPVKTLREIQQLATQEMELLPEDYKEVANVHKVRFADAFLTGASNERVSLVYLGCNKCRKKSDGGVGEMCRMCGEGQMAYRYQARVTIIDDTDSFAATIWDAAEAFFGRTADQVGGMSEEAVDELVQNSKLQSVFKVRIALDQSRGQDGQRRMRRTIHAAYPENYSAAQEHLMGELATMGVSTPKADDLRRKLGQRAAEPMSPQKLEQKLDSVVEAKLEESAENEKPSQSGDLMPGLQATAAPVGAA